MTQSNLDKFLESEKEIAEKYEKLFKNMDITHLFDDWPDSRQKEGMRK